MSSKARKEYLARIHRAQDFIERNLRSDLTLEAVAKVACFSPYHFHKIFGVVTGESLYQYILRLRLEFSAAQICRDGDLSITETALYNGFSSSATFARAFKHHFGMSASEFRKKCKEKNKNRKMNPKNREENSDEASYFLSMFNQTHKEKKQMKTVKPQEIRVRQIPTKKFAYLRHTGPYAGDVNLFQNLFEKMMTWAAPRNLFNPPESELISMYHDDPGITAESKLRLSFGITVPPETEITAPMTEMEIPAGSWACAKFRMGIDGYEGAWHYLMGEWLPESGYQCADTPCYEVALNNPEEDPEGLHDIEIRIPVKPL